MSQRTVLAIEQQDLLNALQAFPGYQIVTAPDNVSLAAKANESVDAILLNGSDPQIAGVVKNLRSHHPLTLLAAVAPSTDAQLPDELDDVVCAPFAKNSLSALLRRAAQTRNLRAEAAFHRAASIRASEEAIGRSDSMREAIRAADEMARVNKPLLIVGEPGTGKDLFARLVHRRSPRAAGPFISVDCAAYPGSLLDRELFGSAGANGVRRGGLIELARGGTLAFDRVSEMSPTVQQRLHAFLTNPDESNNVRIIAMATPAFTQAASSGAFNKEAYASLSAQTLILPPLRERNGDAVLLSDFFLRHFAELHQKPRLAMDLPAKEALANYNWPGNISELKHCIERAVLLANGSTITADQLSLGSNGTQQTITQNSNPMRSITPVTPQTRTASATTTLPVAAQVQNPNTLTFEVGVSLAEVEKQLILRTVSMTRGNRTKAAQVLGISIRTLYSKLLEYDHPTSRKGTDAKAPVAVGV
jgi:two-component system, response regulator FlrC